MKSLDKMTKDELKEMIKELKKENKEKEKGDSMEELKKMLEEVLEGKNSEYEEHDKEIRESFEKLYDGSCCIVITTDKGTLQVGRKIDIMACMCQTIASLINKDMITKTDLDMMIKSIYENEEVRSKINSNKNKIEDLEELLNELFN